MANNYGKQIITMLSDGQALPDSTGADSTNMAYVGGSTNGGLAISVYAKTAISIATAQAFSIELQAFTSDAGTSATSPFQTGGVLEDNAHCYLLHKTSGDGQLDFAAGDLMAQFVIPGEWLDLLSYDWVQLRYLTDADESSETVDAFLHALF